MIQIMARRRAPFWGNGVNRDDLEQVGALAFLAKFDDWDQTRPGHSAWMSQVIDSAMRNCILGQHHPVRIPVRSARQRSLLRSAEEHLGQAYGREPTLGELAAATGSTEPAVLAELRAKTAPARSLDEIGPTGVELGRLLEDPAAWETFDAIAAQLERRDHINQALRQLPAVTAGVLRLTWGLTEDGHELSRSEIAQRYGRSSEWVRLQLRTAERHIRHQGLDRTRRRNAKLTRLDVQQLAPSGDLTWYNLTGLDLTRIDLHRANLHRANLQGANLHRANLQGANLQGANLQGADLHRANLQEANLHRANLQEANLREAGLQGANLQDANLQDANLQEANLLEAGLQGANLRKAYLWRTDLRNADLRAANLRAANLFSLQEADLRGANLQEAGLQGANLQDANLEAANLQEAGLRGADLQGANLEAANLRGADLQGANLEAANLRGADLRGADLRGADLRRADLRATNLWDESLLGAVLVEGEGAVAGSAFW